MMIAVCITAELDCIFSATARRLSKLYTGPNLLPRRSFDCLDVTDSLPAAGGAADSASVPQSSSFTQKHSIDIFDGPGAFFRSPCLGPRESTPPFVLVIEQHCRRRRHAVGRGMRASLTCFVFGGRGGVELGTPRTRVGHHTTILRVRIIIFCRHVVLCIYFLHPI